MIPAHLFAVVVVVAKKCCFLDTRSLFPLLSMFADWGKGPFLLCWWRSSP